MISDSHDSFSAKNGSVDLCANVEVCDEVREMYYKYQGLCEPYLRTLRYADNTIHDHYVYAWFAKTTPKRYFYVGKGTRSRYNHILHKIKDHKRGNKNERFRRFSEIQEKWGIDYEIVIKGLTDYESLIYEECLKLQFIDNGEVLLDVEGVPDDSLIGNWNKENRLNNVPCIIKDRYYERYLEDNSIPSFNTITKENLLNTFFYPYGIDLSDNETICEKEYITNWLTDNNAKIYKTVSTKTRSVIIQGKLLYDRYLDYRNRGLEIYSSKDVAAYIKSFTH